MEKIVEDSKYTENFPSSAVWYMVPYVTEIILPLVAHRTSWKSKVWVNPIMEPIRSYTYPSYNYMKLYNT